MDFTEKMAIKANTRRKKGRRWKRNPGSWTNEEKELFTLLTVGYLTASGYRCEYDIHGFTGNVSPA